MRPFVAFFPPVAIALSSVTLETLSSHYSNALPLMVVEGRFTAYAMDINVVGGMFFIGAAANFLRIFLTRRRPDERISLNLCLLFGLAGLLFPASELWSVDWWLWHILRLGAYLISLPYLFFIFQRFEEELRSPVVELRRSKVELEQFAYVASHDLKEPLPSVASSIKHLDRRVRKGNAEEAGEFIENSLQQLNMMQALISVLLIYSRVGTQAEPFEKISCDAVLRSVLDNLKITNKRHSAAAVAE